MIGKAGSDNSYARIAVYSKIGLRDIDIGMQIHYITSRLYHMVWVEVVVVCRVVVDSVIV